MPGELLGIGGGRAETGVAEVLGVAAAAFGVEGVVNASSDGSPRLLFSFAKNICKTFRYTL